VNVITHSRQTGHAGESSADPEKLAIIHVIEDRLAAAYTLRTREDEPDFGTLDQIYPEWHNGEPAKQRRQWTFHDYLYHLVSYSVHSVWINRPDTAVVKGKKKVQSLRRKKFLKYFHSNIDKTDETHFEITCRRNPSGEWAIVKVSELQEPQQVTRYKLQAPKTPEMPKYSSDVLRMTSDAFQKTRDE